ncbi:TPA: hypothetical protein ENS27_03695 [bacterium]|nr:hypothetical protein [bacterium]
MICVYIESENEVIKKRIRYVMEQLLVPIGYPFTFQAELNSFDNIFTIACIPENKSDIQSYTQKFDIVIPYGDYNSWLVDDVDIKADKVDDIYVLYIKKTPEYLIHDGKIGFDLINIVFYLLSRQEEYVYTHRDLWNRFSATYSILYENGILGIPIINYYIKFLASYIQQQSRQLPEPKWKDGKSFAVVLSHDVDRLSSNYLSIIINKILRARKYSNPASTIISSIKELLSFTKSEKWDLSDLTGKEAQFGFHSTFFIASNTQYRHPDDPHYWINSKLIYKKKKIALNNLAKLLQDEGWEIGLHGSINSYQDQDLLSREKELLIKNTNCSIQGIRQHYLCLDVNKTWQIHEKLGFRYDTTLGFNERIGFRGGVAFPFNPYNFQTEQKFTLLELPMTIMDGSLFSINGEKLDYYKAVQRCNKLFSNIRQTEGLLVINFHPHYYQSVYPEWWAIYEYILNYLSESSVWVATGKEIVDWWSERKKKLYITT